MRFVNILTACLSVVTIAQSAAVVGPVSDEFEIDIVQRDLLSTVLNIGESLLSDINFEGIAGWVNNILTENDHVKYLDDLLIGLKDTGLVPDAALFIVSNNFTRRIAYDVIVDAIDVGEKLNLTSLWIALDNSGLAYDLIAGIIEDPDTFPSILTIIKKFIASGDITIGEIIGDAGNIVGGLFGGGGYANATTTTAATTTKASGGGLFGFLTDAATTTAPSNTTTKAGGGLFGFLTDAKTTTTAAPTSTTTGGGGFFAFLTEGDKSTTSATAATSTTTGGGGFFAFLTEGAKSTTSTTAATTTATGGGFFAFLTEGAASTTSSTAVTAATSVNLAQLSAAIAGGSAPTTAAIAGNLQGVTPSTSTDNAAYSYLASIYKREEDEIVDIARRDNIEALLETIFASVDRSGLLNETIHVLLTNENFQDATVILLSSFFQDLLHGDIHIQIAPLIPTVKSLLASGIIEHIFEKAIADPKLKAAIISDITGLFSSSSSKEVKVLIPGVAKQDAFSAILSDGVSAFLTSIEGDITHALATISADATVAPVVTTSSVPTVAPTLSHSTVSKSVSAPSTSAGTTSGSSNAASPNFTPLGSGLLHIMAAGFMILI